MPSQLMILWFVSIQLVGEGMMKGHSWEKTSHMMPETMRFYPVLVFVYLTNFSPFPLGMVTFLNFLL